MSGQILLRPVQGSDRFRSNASIAVSGGELIVTDPASRQHRFSLDKTRGGAAMLCTYKVAGSRVSHLEQAIIDAQRKAMVKTFPSLWDDQEIRRLVETADLVVTDSPVDEPQSDRADCVDLRALEGTWSTLLVWVAVVVAATLVLVMTLRAVL